MFKISKPPIELTGNLSLKSVTWLVSDKSDFSNLLINNQKDTVNLNSLLVDLPLGEYDKYYVKTKIHYEDNGVDKETNFSKVLIITKDVQAFAVNDVVVNTPKLFVDFDTNNAPLGDFVVSISDFKIFKGLGELKFIEWSIVDESNKIVWSKKRTPSENNDVRIPSCTLTKNQKYILRARFFTTTNSYSNYGKLILTTDKNLTHNQCGIDLTEADCLTRLVATSIYSTLLYKD